MPKSTHFRDEIVISGSIIDYYDHDNTNVRVPCSKNDTVNKIKETTE
jgi:hypothetical protein